MAENQNTAPTALTQQDVAQANEAKANAADATKASVELSKDELEAVAGGRGYGNVVGGGLYDPNAPVRARQLPGS